MHSSGIPAALTLSTIASASRASRANFTGVATTVRTNARANPQPSPRKVCNSRRWLHTSGPCAYSSASQPGASNEGGRPPTANDTLTHSHRSECEVDQGEETNTAQRTRERLGDSSRRRLARRRVPEPLPPVELPEYFIRDNVQALNTLGDGPPLPKALIQDLRDIKRISLTEYDNPPTQRPSQPETTSALELAFFLSTEATLLSLGLLKELGLTSGSYHDAYYHALQYSRGIDLLLDAAWQWTDAIYPARKAEYQYKARPHWWWSIMQKMDSDVIRSLHRDMLPQIRLALHCDYSAAHAMPDLPYRVFDMIRGNLVRDARSPPHPKFDAKASKRPINILTLSGYGGKAVCESVAKYAAHTSFFNYIHLDSWELASLIGDYFGQDLAYNRGPVSTLGYRAAELNGKLAKEHPIISKDSAEDGDDGTSNVFSLSQGNAWEDELQKIKEGSFGCFSKWEILKIDKILREVITASWEKQSEVHDPDQPQDCRPVLIHIHDYVELSMTLEGSAILARLRHVVDSYWQQGFKMSILGTSSSREPSEDYQKMIQELAATDLIVSRHIRPHSVSFHSSDPDSLQNYDYFWENMDNINRMVRDISTSSDPPQVQVDFDDPEQRDVQAIDDLKLPDNTVMNQLRKTIITLPEAYQLAQALIENDDNGIGGLAFLNSRISIGEHLRETPPRSPFTSMLKDPRLGKMVDSAGKQWPFIIPRENAKANDNVDLSDLNEYEKRIASGRIDKDKLRVTFKDVHAPERTIKALKVLTSLALVRPDAFTYGILQNDKITGCLLYGPPGTGKTLLAKAVAKESDANMLEVSGASINDKYVGESEKLIRAVFTMAKRLSPCVVFIDEADAMFASRNMHHTRSSHHEVINQFLKEWDGMEETNAFLMVATNRPFDLDDAVLRRLPRKILVDQPSQADRAAILAIHLKDEDLAPDVSLAAIAERTPFYSGSDLKNVCVAAAMAAVEEENTNAADYTGDDVYTFPVRRTLAGKHFDSALKEIPASISEDMQSLKQIRKFDDEYGDKIRKKAPKNMGFGNEAPKTAGDGAKVRSPGS